jgi:DNA-binding GntR family transcriptional regulator
MHAPGSPHFDRAMEFIGKTDVIAAVLRELIITGEIKPGMPLRQRDLALQFGVSPTPVREALRRLETEGLVHRALHRGATVIEPSIDAEQEGYTVRAALESLAARMAAERLTADDLELMQQIHDELASRKDGDPELADLNQRFHFAIYEASRSPVVLALLRLLWQSFHPAARGRPLPDSVREHGAILQALRDRDEDAAERLTREHILSALDHFRDGRRPRAADS